MNDNLLSDFRNTLATMPLSVDIRILDLYDDFFGLRVASDDEETLLRAIADADHDLLE